MFADGALPSSSAPQVYGAGGHLFGGHPTAKALSVMEHEFAQHGTTGFLATMATNTNSIFEAGISEAKIFRDQHVSLGNFWGLHFEGPFLNPKRCGAHPPELIQKGDEAAAVRLLEGSTGVVKMIAVAPELTAPAALDLIKQAGVVLSCGHSNASYDEGLHAFSALGIRAATHLYNAMPSMHHRDPGLVAAILETKPYTSIVADGIHVDFGMVKLAKRELSKRLFLITDAVTDSSEGIYPHVFKGDRYTMPDGTLSGSALTMLAAVRNCVCHCNIPIVDAIRMASLYPAEVIGADHVKGDIRIGWDADFLVFDDDWKVFSTYIGGVCVYSA